MLICTKQGEMGCGDLVALLPLPFPIGWRIHRALPQPSDRPVLIPLCPFILLIFEIKMRLEQ